jgi:hypothetical protein
METRLTHANILDRFGSGWLESRTGMNWFIVRRKMLEIRGKARLYAEPAYSLTLGWA